ncbi:MAG: cation transporter [Anaerovoracaceae bacterium]|jgi:copper chaperone CopZ
MKRSYKLDGLCCANCAAEMEREINKMDDVKDCSIAFMSQRMNIEIDGDDMDPVLDKAQKIISKVEGDCVIKR